jgi:exopolysaccharide production protein ExoZ
MGLQYLRAVAATGVLAFHAFPGRFGFLTFGVDLFFTLSGFLMVVITNDSTRPLPFFKDRFLRVVPLYWLVNILALGVLATKVAWAVPLHTHYVLESFAFIPARQTDGQILPMVGQGWTLNLEMLFYTMFALALFLPPRWRLPAVAAALVSLVAAGAMLRPDFAPFIAWTNPILLEFLVGAVIGARWKQGGTLLPMLGLIVTAMALHLALSPWLGGATLPWRTGYYRAAVSLPLSTLLLVVLAFERRPGGIPEWRPLRILGDASYSIYLWQTFALMLWYKLARHFALSDVSKGVGIVLTGLIGGVMAYYLIERPMLALLRRYRHGRAPLPVAQHVDPIGAVVS